MIYFESLRMEHDISIPLGLGFDDVLLVPQYSRVVTRKRINLQTRLSRSLLLNIPIVSANMDTVTESKMAIALARSGGIGIIHRFMSIDDQVEHVLRVKRAETLVITEPLCIKKEALLDEAIDLMKKRDVRGLLVTDDNAILEGIVTARDVRFRNDREVTIQEIMTPRERLITAQPGISKEAVLDIFNKHKIEKIPLIDERGILKGLITAADFFKMGKYRQSAKDVQGRLLVGAAIGVKDGIERSARLVRAGVDVLVIDIAHGHHETVMVLLKELKKSHPHIDVIAGNVATAQATNDLIQAGADGVKVGIGPGQACSTRIVAGAGVPQFTAVREASRVARSHGVPIIADGGIKNSGDLAKIIGVGASTAMIGGLFAGTKESPGNYFFEDGVAFKTYRGLASREASIDRAQTEPDLNREDRAAEGISTKVAYRGDVARVIRMLTDGLQSGMSYSGAETIDEFWNRAQFIRVTEAGIREGKPRP